MKQNLVYALVAALAVTGPASANNIVTGSSTTTDVTLDSATNWRIVRSVDVNIPQSDSAMHGCVATASADVQNPGPANRENQYRFVLSLDDDSPAAETSAERMLELVDNPGSIDDPDSKPIATTRTFRYVTRTSGPGGTGKHTFYFLGRKVEEGDSNAKVEDVSLTVVCVHSN